MNSEALRLLDEMYHSAFAGFANAFIAPDGFNDTYDQLRAILSASDDVPDFSTWPSVHDLTPAREREDPQFSAWRNRMPDKHWARYDLSAVRLGFELGRAVFAAPQPPNGETK